MTLKPEDPRPSPVGREELARVIASALGDDFDHAFVNKSEWNRARGEKGGRYRDINEPMQDDYLAAADATLALMAPADGWRPAATLPPTPTDETWRIFAHCPTARVPVRELVRYQEYEGAEWAWSTPHGVRSRGYIVLPEHIADWMPLPAAPPPPGGQG